MGDPVRILQRDAEAQIGHRTQGRGLAGLVGAVDQVQIRRGAEALAGEIQCALGEGAEGVQQQVATPDPGGPTARGR